MKKLLLSLLAVASMASQALAIDITPTSRISVSNPEPKVPLVMRQDAPNMQASRADGYVMRFCGNIETWYGLGDAYDVVQVLFINAEMATQLAGNKISLMGFSAVPQTATPGIIGVWETDDLSELNQEPVFKKEITVQNSYNSSQYYQTVSIPSDQQYEIKENTAFCFGYKFRCTAKDYPIGVDAGPANKMSGYVACFNPTSGAFVGAYYPASDNCNLFLYARTVGEKTGLTNMFEVGDCVIGGYALPVFSDKALPETGVYVNNTGTNALTSIDFTYSFNGGEAVTKVADINFPGSTEDYLLLPINDYPEGRGKLDVTVNKINGVEVNKSSTASFYNLGNSDGYDRKFVVEEGTGTWCGWCPRGIVGFEYMEATYPDSFIGIAVHYNDKMAATSYQPLVSRFFSGFPICIMNRDPGFIVDPSEYYLNLGYNYWKPQASPVKVSIEAALDEASKVINASAKLNFACDEATAPYSVAYVVLENGIVGNQTNNYAGSSTAMGGWEKYKSSQLWEYKHVARNIYDVFGLKTDMPTSIKAGEEYALRFDVPLTGVADVSKSSVVILVLDDATGTILNAAKVEFGDYASISDAVVAGDGKVEYYNIQGVKVAEPREGALYIRVQDGKAQKVIM